MDNLDEYNKRVLISQETLAMQQAATTVRQQEIDARQKLEDQLDNVIESSDYSQKLKGKEAEFKRFARNSKNRGIAADTLAKAFLFDVEESPTLTPMREALPAGSGGPRDDLAPKKLSLEEVFIAQGKPEQAEAAARTSHLLCARAIACLLVLDQFGGYLGSRAMDSHNVLYCCTSTLAVTALPVIGEKVLSNTKMYSPAPRFTFMFATVILFEL